MLESTEETGLHKNASYAISCVCRTPFGFQLLVQSITLFHRTLISIEAIVVSLERETVWFALM